MNHVFSPEEFHYITRGITRPILVGFQVLNRLKIRFFAKKMKQFNWYAYFRMVSQTWFFVRDEYANTESSIKQLPEQLHILWEKNSVQLGKLINELVLRYILGKFLPEKFFREVLCNGVPFCFERFQILFFPLFVTNWEGVLFPSF